MSDDARKKNFVLPFTFLGIEIDEMPSFRCYCWQLQTLHGSYIMEQPKSGVWYDADGVP